MSNKEKLSRSSNSEHDDQSIEPYIGPRPFRRDKKDEFRFSGRDAEIDEIVALITSHRIVLIYAQSGVGKTSIFNAGVIPSLEKDGFEVLPMARVQITSTTSPISPKNSNNIISSQIENIYIYNALQSLSLHPEIDPYSISNLSLFQFLDKYFPTHKDKNREMRPQVLIFDQLEELFSFYPDNWIEQQIGFFKQVADSLDNNPLLRIVFIIREDFLAQLDPFRSILPEKLRTRFRLERLRRKEATLAIKQPLTNMLKNASEDEMRNIDSEINALVNDLLKMYVEASGGGVRQLEGEFIEPIQLQVVCRRWWHEREEASKRPGIKKTSLEDLGNVDMALEDFYEDAIRSASKQTGVREGEIGNWCQENLITSSGTRSIIHRGHETTEGIDNNVIDWLERKYLIRKEWRSGASWYELTHDRLIKPMMSSNAKWKNANDRKKNKRVILTISGLAVAAVIVTIVVSQYYFSQQAPTSTANSAPPPISSVIGKEKIGTLPIGVDVNPNTNMVYVANSNSNTVSIVHGTTKNESKSNGGTASGGGGATHTTNLVPPSNVTVGTLPYAVAVNPNTNMVYVANSGSNTVSVINGTTNTVVQNVTVGISPYGIAVNPNITMIYVANYDSNTVSVIDGTTNSVVQTVPVGISPVGVDVNPKTNMVYVANHDDGTLSIIK